MIFVRVRDGILGGSQALQQAGLVSVSHRGATRVHDWRATGGLDLLAQLPLTAGEAPDPTLLRSIMELRLCVGADAARRCSARSRASRSACATA
ncbi:MAG TPA: hypothetical protein VNA28_07355 [Solirubrobacteraceae bacterium]|nr:hypothetical protein [Solirubrobacteraceae bacterium]